MILTETEQAELERARDFLCGYRLCADMLGLQKYERKRKERFDPSGICEDVLAGDEAYWHARMYEVGMLLGKMKASREKLLLYYHYVKGESIERTAALLGVSRRTGYRLHQRGLLKAAHLLKRM